MEENITFMSGSIDLLAASLSAFQGELEQPKLNKSNPYFKSRYVDLSGVLSAVQPVLVKHDLSISQMLIGSDLVTMLMHKSGQWLKSVCPIGAYKSQQDRGSAITYTKRYAICAMLGVAADTDDDGNSASDADKKQPLGQGDLAKALEEVKACVNIEEFNELWVKWSNEAPGLCKAGSELYNAFGAKSQELRNNK